MGLLLHRDVLCKLSVAGLRVHPQLLVMKGQLLVALALGLRELVEPRPSLDVSGAVARCWLQFRAARCQVHADVALPRRVTLQRGPCPPSHHGSGAAPVVHKLLT
jgi:hypothetical protein